MRDLITTNASSEAGFASAEDDWAPAFSLKLYKTDHSKSGISIIPVSSHDFQENYTNCWELVYFILIGNQKRAVTLSLLRRAPLPVTASRQNHFAHVGQPLEMDGMRSSILRSLGIASMYLFIGMENRLLSRINVLSQSHLNNAQGLPEPNSWQN